MDAENAVKESGGWSSGEVVTVLFGVAIIFGGYWFFVVRRFGEVIQRDFAAAGVLALSIVLALVLFLGAKKERDEEAQRSAAWIALAVFVAAALVAAGVAAWVASLIFKYEEGVVEWDELSAVAASVTTWADYAAWAALALSVIKLLHLALSNKKEEAEAERVAFCPLPEVEVEKRDVRNAEGDAITSIEAVEVFGGCREETVDEVYRDYLRSRLLSDEEDIEALAREAGRMNIDIPAGPLLAWCRRKYEALKKAYAEGQNEA